MSPSHGYASWVVKLINLLVLFVCVGVITWCLPVPSQQSETEAMSPVRKTLTARYSLELSQVGK